MQELLKLENDLLRDYIDISNQNHELELIETVLSCINQEGTVSKSLEIMFGETVEDMSTFDTFCLEQYLCAVEGFIKNAFNETLDDNKTDRIIDKLRKGIKKVKSVVSEKGNSITFPIKLPKSDKFRTISNLRQFMSSVTDKYRNRKYIEAYREIEEFKNEPSKYSKDVTIDNISGIDKFVEEINKFILEEGTFVKQVQEFSKVAKEITAHELVNFDGPRFKITTAQIQRLASFTFRASCMFYVQSLNRIISQIASPKVDRGDDFKF